MPCLFSKGELFTISLRLVFGEKFLSSIGSLLSNEISTSSGSPTNGITSIGNTNSPGVLLKSRLGFTEIALELTKTVSNDNLNTISPRSDLIIFDLCAPNRVALHIIVNKENIILSNWNIFIFKI